MQHSWDLMYPSILGGCQHFKMHIFLCDIVLTEGKISHPLLNVSHTRIQSHAAAKEQTHSPSELMRVLLPP